MKNEVRACMRVWVTVLVPVRAWVYVCMRVRMLECESAFKRRTVGVVVTWKCLHFYLQFKVTTWIPVASATKNSAVPLVVSHLGHFRHQGLNQMFLLYVQLRSIRLTETTPWQCSGCVRLLLSTKYLLFFHSIPQYKKKKKTRFALWSAVGPSVLFCTAYVSVSLCCIYLCVTICE